MIDKNTFKKSSDIAKKIRDEIHSGHRKPRERLPPERLLAKEFGVSRTTVRRALSQLSKEMLVNVQRGSGSYVSTEPMKLASGVFETARPLELMDVRFALEPHICRLAVLNAAKHHFEELDSLISIMEANILNKRIFSDADTSFHSILAESTGNPLLLWFSEQIKSARGQQHWSLMSNLTLEAETILKYNSQHRDIVEAIRRRNPEEAALQMHNHLETARLSLSRASST